MGWVFLSRGNAFSSLGLSVIQGLSCIRGCALVVFHSISVAPPNECFHIGPIVKFCLHQVSQR